MFSKCGRSLYLGRRDATLVHLDLRLSAQQHTVGEFPTTRSICGVRQMTRRHDDEILTQSFSGEVFLCFITN
jgi:hypothetical protein